MTPPPVTEGWVTASGPRPTGGRTSPTRNTGARRSPGTHVCGPRCSGVAAGHRVDLRAVAATEEHGVHEQGQELEQADPILPAVSRRVHLGVGALRRLGHPAE